MFQLQPSVLNISHCQLWSIINHREYSIHSEEQGESLPIVKLSITAES